MADYSLDQLQEFVGQELGVSSWLLVDQARVNQFAACTGDHQWIHVDQERAARESPLSSTIVHGYLTLSLLPMLAGQVGMVPAGVSHVLNYGTDKVRFLSPVKVGSRVRVRVELVGADEKRAGQFLVKMRNTVEIEDEEKPAMVAETLSLLFRA